MTLRIDRSRGLSVLVGTVGTVTDGYATYVSGGREGGPARIMVLPHGDLTGTPCLIVLPSGSLSDAWIIPFPDQEVSHG